MNLLSRLAVLILAGGAVLVTSACSRTGDFGRTDIDPTYTYAVTQAPPDERTDHFVLTDEEREMNARIYRFINMDHTVPWLHRSLIADAGPGGLDETSYYQWLRSERYASSRGPFNRLVNDVRLDLASLPQVFASICAVQEIDRRRDLAAGSLVNIEPAMQAGANERLAENRARINQFSAALSFRYDAYVYALEHLLVETPHEEARNADTLITELATASQSAYSDRFCTQPRNYAQTPPPNPLMGAI